MVRARIRNLVIPLTCSAVLTGVVTWPLVFTTGRIADWCDVLFSAWVLSWGTHALSTAPASIANANIFWPDHNALFYGPAALGALPWFAPVYLVTGNPVRAVNSTLLICLTLTGTSLHWLVWRWTRNHAAGFVAAATFLTTPWVSQLFIPLVPHIAALQLFPVIVYLASSDLARMRQIAVLTVAVIVQCLTDLVYVAPAVLAPLGALAVIRLARGSTRRSGVRLAGVVVASSVVLAPLLQRYASVSAGNAEIAQQTLWMSRQMATTALPLDLITPGRPAEFRLTAVSIVVVGLALALLRRHGFVRLCHSRAWRTALFWCAAGFALSLGSRIFFGSIEVPGPQALLAQWLPTIDRVRVPSRLGVAALIGFSLLVGLAFATLAERLRRALRSSAQGRVLVGALALAATTLLWFDFGVLLMAPIPIKRIEIEPPPASFLAILAREAGPLVELPSGPLPRHTGDHPRGGQALEFARQQARAMLDSTFHWHPILNGYSSYFPPGFARRLELSERLPTPTALVALLAESSLRFIWVHMDRLDEKQRARWTAQISLGTLPLHPGIRLIASEGDERLFVVDR